VHADDLLVVFPGVVGTDAAINHGREPVVELLCEGHRPVGDHALGHLALRFAQLSPDVGLRAAPEVLPARCTVLAVKAECPSPGAIL
jgi:hypothetical protein